MEKSEILSIDALEAKIKERKEKIQWIIDAVKTIARRGRLVNQDTENSYTKCEWLLNDFNGFDFSYSDGLSMFGGIDIKVWYKDIVERNPSLKNDSHFRDSRILIFHIQQFNSGKLNVYEFSDDQKHFEKLEYAIQHQDEIAKEIEDDLKRYEAVRLARMNRAVHREQLLKEAKELKL